MFKKSWYMLLAWTLGTFYVFIMAVVVISIFSPGPSEEQAMNWMHQMMNASHSSLMGWSMERNEIVNYLLVKTSALVLPAIFAGAILGILLKVRRQKHER